MQEDELSQRQIKIAKLREIGRKYRQEADELKRQLSSTQAKGLPPPSSFLLLLLF